MGGLRALLDKDAVLPLPQRISGILRERILGGVYGAGQRLESVRRFADDFQVSPVTIIKAMDLLEDDRLIRRIPMKGIFVNPASIEGDRRLSACFVFPEREMSEDVLTRENWGLSSELYRGLLTAARKHSIDLQFSYFPEHPSGEMLTRQSSALRRFDFVVFPGLQHPELREAVSRRCPVFCKVTQGETLPGRQIAVDYDREDAMDQVVACLQGSGIRDAAVVTFSSGIDARARIFLERAGRAGVRITEEEVWPVGPEASGWQAALGERLAAGRPRFVFCDNSDYMEELYVLCQQLGLRIGRDVVFTAICSGATFRGLLPRSTYFRIPNYEIGVWIMESALRSIRNDAPIPAFSPLKVERTN